MLPTNPLLNATAPAGPHLPAALLRQYAAGTLAPAAQHRVEAHTLACPRCADILEGLLQTPPTTTDQALAQLQQRLRQRVQQQAAPARLAQRPRRHRWLAPQLATAAALLLAMLAAGWWAWQQRQHATAPMARVAPPRPAAAPTPPAPADATSVAEVPSVPPATVARPARIAATTTPKRHTATAPVAQGRAITSHSNTTSRAVSQPLAAAAPAAATTDSAVKTLSEVAVAPTPPSPAKASEAAARLRAAMPPPPALAAAPTGGYAALREYLKKEAADFEPETPDGPRRTGRVLVRLHIGADGKIEQAEAVRKLRADYDAEAIRMLQEGPAWVPGISGGRRAAQTIEVPVEFE